MSPECIPVHTASAARNRASQLHFVVQNEPTLDQQTGRATAWVVDFHPWLGVSDSRDDEANFCGSVKLTCTRNATLRELADQILVAPADNVWLGVCQSKPLFADSFDEILSRSSATRGRRELSR